jgi:uncharacterized protein (TIGR02186 family)
MMRGVQNWRKIAASLLCLAALTGANAPVLVPEVSQHKIGIFGDFTGAQLLLFGAITYPKGVPAQDKVDIVVVLKGPDQSIVVREKRQIAGIWVNADSSEFRSAPGYYAVASSRPIPQIVDEKTADIYELGLDHLQLSPAGSIDSQELRRFSDGLVDLNRRGKLFKYLPGAVKITNSVLYQARISLPANVPVGDYTAETFLIMNGRVQAAEVREIAIFKSGFSRWIYGMAQNYGFIYGLFAVLLSIGLGWIAGQIFRRI